MLLSFHILLSLISNISIILAQKNEACPNNDFTFIAKQNGKIPSNFAVSYISYGVPGHYSITIAADKTGGRVAQVKNVREAGKLTNKDAPYGKCKEKYFGNSQPKSVSAVSVSKAEKKQDEIQESWNKGGCCIRAVNTKAQSSAPAEHPLLPPRLEDTIPNFGDRSSWNLSMFAYINILLISEQHIPVKANKICCIS